jgi:signal transduction histidine kinase
MLDASLSTRQARAPNARLSSLDYGFRALAILTALLTVVVALNIVTHPDAPGVAGQGVLGRIFLGLLTGPTLLLFGSLLLWRVPRNIIGHLLILLSIQVIGVQFFNELSADTRSLLVFELLLIWGAGITAPSIGYLMMNFPTGHLYPPQWLRWVQLAVGIKFVGTFLEVMANPGAIKFIMLPVNPLYVPALAPLLPWLTPTIGITGLMLPLIIVAGLVSLVLRYRASDTLQQQQIKWVIWSFVLCGLAILSAMVVIFAQREPLVPLGVAAPLIAPVPILLVATMTVAIMRYHLFDIDFILNRTFMYGALTVCIVTLYVLVVGALSTLLHTSGNLIVSLLATGLIAILFQPLRERLQRVINRLIYGERDEPYAVLSKLGQQLEATLAPDAVLRTIVETVAQALKVPYVAISLKSNEQHVLSAEYGNTALMTQYSKCLPLNYQHELLGELVVAPRPGEDRFSNADLHLLNDLARQAGIAVHAARLTTDLQHSRERLVTAREEERRRMRRDLHDGLGPTLASLTLKLDAVRNLLQRDLAAADLLLAELKTQTQGAIGDIRRLVYDLRPPALDELGLVSALREQIAQHFSSNGLNVSLETPEALPALPAAVEVAIYRIVLEALTNVTRHAHATTCTVRLTLADAAQVEVSDNGVGLPSTTRAGVGFSSMRERAAELGGTCVIEALPGGGTRVLARLPVSGSHSRDQTTAEAPRSS